MQIIHGYTGFLVNTPEEATHYLIYLLRNKQVREKIGQDAREHVRNNFLMTRELRDYLMVMLLSIQG